MRRRIFVCIVGIAGVFVLAGCMESERKVSSRELEQWRFLGMGEKMVRPDEGFVFSETPGSKGAMIISPEAYPEDVTVRCEMKAMTPDTVLVILVSLSDFGATQSLTVPADYDGNINWLFEDVANYFYAFHNAPHDHAPFIRRNDGSPKTLKELAKNVMETNTWTAIEAGKSGTKLWLNIGGEKVLEVTDPSPLEGGHVSFRIRGTQTGIARCAIRNVEIRGQ